MNVFGDLVSGTRLLVRPRDLWPPYVEEFDRPVVVRSLPTRTKSANLTIILSLLAEGIKTRRHGNRGGRRARPSGRRSATLVTWSDRMTTETVIVSTVTGNDAVPTVPAAVLHESDSSLWQFLKFPIPSYL